MDALPAVSMYQGLVSHHRWKPTAHGFTYSVSMVLLNLEEAEAALGRWGPLAGCDTAWAVASFRSWDHMNNFGRMDSVSSLERVVRSLVAEATGTRPVGKIFLLTNLAYWGYCFNPASFYYILDSTNARIETIIAEVTNTPWNEQHYYILNSSVKGVAELKWDRVAGWIAGTATTAMAQTRNTGNKNTLSSPCDGSSPGGQLHGVETREDASALASAGAVSPTHFQSIVGSFEAAHAPVLQPDMSTTARQPTGVASDGSAASSSTTAALFGTDGASAASSRLRFQWQKDFHVSPFMSMDHTYDWIFSTPGSTLLVQSQNIRAGERYFATQTRLVRRDVTLSSLLYFLLVAFPALTLRIQIWIHIEAFRLWWKGVPLHAHPHGSSSGFTRLVAALMVPLMWIVGLFTKSGGGSNGGGTHTTKVD